MTITDEALTAAVKLSARYINDRFLPDKAIDLIDEASSKVRLTVFVEPPEIQELEEEIKPPWRNHKEDAIKSEAYEKAGDIKKKAGEEAREDREDPRKMAEGEKHPHSWWWARMRSPTWCPAGPRSPSRSWRRRRSQRLMKLESILHERVIGQEEAVTAVSQAPSAAAGWA